MNVSLKGQRNIVVVVFFILALVLFLFSSKLTKGNTEPDSSYSEEVEKYNIILHDSDHYLLDDSFSASLEENDAIVL